MEFTAKEIAGLLGGTVDGNPDVKVNRLARIEDGEPEALSFLANPKYSPFIYTTLSSIVLVQSDFEAEQELTCTLIRVDIPTPHLQTCSIFMTKCVKGKQELHPYRQSPNQLK